MAVLSAAKNLVEDTSLAVQDLSVESQINGPISLLTLNHVSKRFQTSRHDTTALNDISLDIKEGEFICVVGPSGCGKSTLLNLIAGLDTPSDGTLIFDGKPIA